MNLVLAIYDLYKTLLDNHLIEKMPNLEEIDKVSELCFKKKYKQIDKWLKAPLSNEVYNSIKNRIDNIKKVVSDEQERNN